MEQNLLSKVKKYACAMCSKYAEHSEFQLSLICTDRQCDKIFEPLCLKCYNQNEHNMASHSAPKKLNNVLEEITTQVLQARFDLYDKDAVIKNLKEVSEKYQQMSKTCLEISHNINAFTEYIEQIDLTYRFNQVQQHIEDVVYKNTEQVLRTSLASLKNFFFINESQMVLKGTILNNIILNFNESMRNNVEIVSAQLDSIFQETTILENPNGFDKSYFLSSPVRKNAGNKEKYGLLYQQQQQQQQSFLSQPSSSASQSVAAIIVAGDYSQQQQQDSGMSSPPNIFQQATILQQQQKSQIQTPFPVVQLQQQEALKGSPNNNNNNNNNNDAKEQLSNKSSQLLLSSNLKSPGSAEKQAIFVTKFEKFNNAASKELSEIERNKVFQGTGNDIQAIISSVAIKDGKFECRFFIEEVSNFGTDHFKVALLKEQETNQGQLNLSENFNGCLCCNASVKMNRLVNTYLQTSLSDTLQIFKIAIDTNDNKIVITDCNDAVIYENESYLYSGVIYRLALVWQNAKYRIRVIDPTAALSEEKKLVNSFGDI